MIKDDHKRHLPYYLSIVLLVFIFSSCATVKHVAVTKDLKGMVNQSEVLQNQHIGYYIYDPENDRTLIGINEDKYFTPASNTKLFTLYASLLSLPDSVPTFAYEKRGNVLIVEPLGDPTFLHPDFYSQNTIRQISEMSADTLVIAWPEEPSRYGPGWSWDDYSYGYQVERTALPMFGNVLNVTQIDSSIISPAFFQDFVDFQKDPAVYRDRYQNIFHIPEDTLAGDTTTYRVPIQNNRELTELLLADTTNLVVRSADRPYYLTDTLYNGPTLPLLALMTQRSDNFLAEQLLYMSSQLNGQEGVEQYIDTLARNELSFLPDPLIWVDGSGLSRYNMITPRNLVGLLGSMLENYEWKELETILPVGGINGTLRNWYGADVPYVFAKTGTLRHNHCLSGYMITRSGKTLIFSFMNNHFTTPSSTVKWEMQRILEALRDSY